MSKTSTIHCLNSILQEILGVEGAELFGKQFFEDYTRQESKTKNSRWITVQDPSLAQLILRSLGDEDKKKILNTVLDEPRTFMEIMEIAKLPPSSAYRKIITLIDDGLLINLGSETSSEGKRKIKYKSIFENIEINMDKNKVIIKILLTCDAIKRCFAVRAIQCR